MHINRALWPLYSVSIPVAHLPLTVALTDCDSCVMTLLNDLAAMGNELHLVKSQLHGLSTSTGSLEQMKHLETQIKELRVNTSRMPGPE